MFAECNYGGCRWSRFFEPGDINGPGLELLEHWEKCHPDKRNGRVVAYTLSDGDEAYQRHNEREVA